MALESAFSNELHFSVDSIQARDDERTDEGDIDDADLEEGEIADEDDEGAKAEDGTISEEAQQSQQGGTDKGIVSSGSNGGSHEKTGSTLRPKEGSQDKRRDSKARSNIGVSSRVRKRPEDGLPMDTRDLNRKRRKGPDGDPDDMEEVDLDMMNARGHSPLNRPQRFGGGEETGSDFEDGLNSMRFRQRVTGEGRHQRLGRANSPGRRRGTRGGSRERGLGSDRRRSERGGGLDRSERDRRHSKPHQSPLSNLGSFASKSIKDESICAFYMEGKCSRGSDCPYSHAALPPRKMELCKFYLMDCCAKKEKCLYLHKDFPCKFFHTGKKCRFSNEDCKFSHEVLSETMRAILIKHIETAPREILGDFPRLTREETILAIEHHSPHPNGRERRPHIPALFEPFAGGSNVPTEAAEPHTQSDIQNSERRESKPSDGAIESSTPYRHAGGFYQEATKATELDSNHGGRSPEENNRSIWFGHLRQEAIGTRAVNTTTESKDAEESNSMLSPHCPPSISSSTVEDKNVAEGVNYFETLPARQRQLFRRIQQTQREPISSNNKEDMPGSEGKNSSDEKCYSSDDEEGTSAKSISDIIKTIREKPVEMVSDDSDNKVNTPGAGTIGTCSLNLASLKNINVAEIAKALSTLQQTSSPITEGTTSDTGEAAVAARDPRARDPRTRNNLLPMTSNLGDVDLRVPISGLVRHLAGAQDVDLRFNNIRPLPSSDIDLRSGLVPRSLGHLENVCSSSSDIDLRTFSLPFKNPTTIANNYAAQEIDASFDSHPLMEYRVWIVDCIPLDYSLIRVRSEWAHLDPRQQKSFSSGDTAVRDVNITTDTPSIPLGPASPDAVSMSSSTIGHHSEAGFNSYDSASLRGLGNNDPRVRDPRSRSTVTPCNLTSPLLASQQPEKRGLLGMAPPGMLPFLAKTHNPRGPIDNTYDDSGYGSTHASTQAFSDRCYPETSNDREQPSRPAENRRDPRQRMNNSSHVDLSHQSYTPPPANDRHFR